VIFIQGIWWKPGNFFSRKMKAESDKEKQKYLDHDPNVAPSTFVQTPDGAAGNEEDAFLQFLPGAVGSNTGASDLPEFDDSFEMYEDE
jgi:hypothetical protein